MESAIFRYTAHHPPKFNWALNWPLNWAKKSGCMSCAADSKLKGCIIKVCTRVPSIMLFCASCATSKGSRGEAPEAPIGLRPVGAVAEGGAVFTAAGVGGKPVAAPLLCTEVLVAGVLASPKGVAKPALRLELCKWSP